MVGDPTDKNEMRKMMSVEEINYNIEKQKAQMARFIDFSENRAVAVNNADWLMPLQYMSFIRDYGVHFTVNRMLAADCYKTRFERGGGLTLFEFNYMVIQAYDFLELFRKYGCLIQYGGNDQWSNIIAGVDLIRRVERKEAYGLTCKLLERSDGVKMGKSMSGAVWLDGDKTSPYELYQFVRNTADADVITFLKLLTFVPMGEINDYAKREGAELNAVKDVLAYEVTKIVHGQDEAEKARNASAALFVNKNGPMDDAPAVEITQDEASEGVSILDLLVRGRLVPSRAEAKRNVQQGGVTLDGVKVSDIGFVVKGFPALLQKGKKGYCRIIVGG
jgi:tyrosyl-tRNA synthetase